MINHKKYERERERETSFRETSDGDRARERDRERERSFRETSDGDRARERERRLLEKRVTGTERERERETSFREMSDGGRERESVTHAAFLLGTIPYPDTLQAISQHHCDVTRSRDCSRSILSLVPFVFIFFIFIPRGNLVTNFATARR